MYFNPSGEHDGVVIANKELGFDSRDTLSETDISDVR
jgi:hypothetical protein